MAPLANLGPLTPELYPFVTRLDALSPNDSTVKYSELLIQPPSDAAGWISTAIIPGTLKSASVPV